MCPSPAKHPHFASPTTLLSTLLELNGLEFQLTWGVALRVPRKSVRQLWGSWHHTGCLQRSSNKIQGKRKTLYFPKYTALVWVMAPKKSWQQCALQWLPLPSPSPIRLYFSEGPSVTEEQADRGYGLARGLESIIAHTFTWWYLLRVHRVYQSQGDKRRIR